MGKNGAMKVPNALRLFGLSGAAMLLLVSCAAGATAGWTYAPLGPSPTPATSEAPTSAPSSPSGSGGAGVTITMSTEQDNPLAFVPAELTVPAGAQVTVDYTNNSNLPHNINFFDGPDQNSNSIAKTDIVTGPGALETVTFTAPSTPGDYFFWCDVHQTAMQGIYHVQ